MKIALTIIIAALAGAAWVLVLSRARSGQRRRPTLHPDQVRPDTQGVLDAYRRGDYETVTSVAPAVVAGLNPENPDDRMWRRRLQLAWGHACFELDRFAQAAELLEQGLSSDGADLNDAPELTGQARFMHCLGFARQKTGDEDGARDIYTSLLADADLDPAVRTIVEQNLQELDGAPDAPI